MDLKCQLLLYLDRKRFLAEMEKYCEIFLKQLCEKPHNFLSLRCIVEVDVMELIEMLPDLGTLLFKEPFKWKMNCDQILLACVQSMNQYRYVVNQSQVSVDLRLKCVPPLSQPNPVYYSGLVTFNGILLSVSKASSYIYHSVWRCPDDCEENETVLQCIPKVTPKCQVCSSVQFENSGLRRCGEQVIATFKVNNSLPITFEIRDDLIEKLNLGSKYNIYATILKKTRQAWSIEEVPTLPAPVTAPILADIKDLLKTCKSVPWQFIYCLASSIAVNIGPLNSFITLKINLLLSLTSVKANQISGSAIIHVLAAGADSGHVRLLIEEASQLADRSVFFGTTNNTASTALIASSGGVCMLPLPLQCYNQKQMSPILSAIETGEITTEHNKVKLRSAVWAHGMDFKKVTLSNIANVFGNFCRGDDVEFNDEIAVHKLQHSIAPAEKTKLDIEALKELSVYIDVIAGFQVSLDKGSEKLLRSYFLAARKENSRLIGVGCMGGLVAVCMTSARLCRRNITCIDDAVFAIWLHVGGCPEPRFAPEEYLETPEDMKRLKKIISQFKDWLEQFTGFIYQI